jgi:glyceraldehyde 3-phosphate dehydrogenase
MQKVNVGINGFGRIGRTFFRLAIKNSEIDVKAINDLAPVETMAHLLKYDSIHGILADEVSFDNHHLIINGIKIKYTQIANPADIYWDNIDVVLESSGKFKTYEKAYQHILGGAKRVILSAPPEDDNIKTIVLGVNEHILDGSELIISNASCTTNNAAPMLKIIHDLCDINQAYITTVHSYTTDQSLHDEPHRDLRRARAAGQSIVPTSTGAAKALTKIFPEFENRLGGSGIRVPVANGSLTDITCYVNKPVAIEELNKKFYEASTLSLKGILAYTKDPIVSVDIKGNTHSCLFDSELTSVLGQMVKVVGWYDNEIGYSSRLLDLIKYISD